MDLNELTKEDKLKLWKKQQIELSAEHLTQTKQEIERLQTELQNLLDKNIKKTDDENHVKIHSDSSVENVPPKTQPSKRKTLPYNPVSISTKEPTPKKVKHYDKQIARDYIKKQKQQRKEKLKEQQNTLTPQDLKKQRLKELQEKTRQLVSENVKRSTRRSLNPKESPGKNQYRSRSATRNCDKNVLKLSRNTTDSSIQSKRFSRSVSRDNKKNVIGKCEIKNVIGKIDLRNGKNFDSKRITNSINQAALAIVNDKIKMETPKTKTIKTQVPSNENANINAQNLKNLQSDLKPNVKDSENHTNIKNSQINSKRAQDLRDSDIAIKHSQVDSEIPSSKPLELKKPQIDLKIPESNSKFAQQEPKIAQREPKIAQDKKFHQINPKLAQLEAKLIQLNPRLSQLDPASHKSSQNTSPRRLKEPIVALENYLQVCERIKAATIIQRHWRGYKQRKKYKMVCELRKKLQNKTFVSNEPTVKIIPSWLQPATSLPYPYNFISSVKKKLSIATRNLQQSNDIGIKIERVEKKPSEEFKTYNSHGNIPDLKLNLNFEPEQKISENKTEYSDVVLNKSDTESDSDTTKNIPEISEESRSLSLKARRKIESVDAKKMDDIKIDDVIKTDDVLKKLKSVDAQKPKLDVSKIKLDIKPKLDVTKLKLDLSKLDVKKTNVTKLNVTNLDKTKHSDLTKNITFERSWDDNVQNLSPPKIHLETKSHQKYPSDIESILSHYSKSSQRLSQKSDSSIKTLSNDLRISKSNSELGNVNLDKSYKENLTDSEIKTLRSSDKSKSLQSRSKTQTSIETSKFHSSLEERSKTQSNIERPKHSTSEEIKTEVSEDKPKNFNRVKYLTETIKPAYEKPVYETNPDLDTLIKSSQKFLNESEIIASKISAKKRSVSEVESITESKKTSIIDDSIRTDVEDNSSIKEESFVVEMIDTKNIPKLVKPTASLKVKQNFGNEDKDAKNKSNHLHLKFEAELHLLNSFNNSLQQVVEVEKSLLGIEENKNIQLNLEPINVSLSAPDLLQAPEDLNTCSKINFKRGCDTSSELLNAGQSAPNLNNMDLEQVKTTTYSTTINSIITKLANEKNVQKNNRLIHNNPVSMAVFDSMIEEEDARIELLKTVLKIRERTLLDRTRGELAWLEIQKQHFINCGLTDKLSNVKKKQRGLLIKYQQERHEMQRLKKAHKKTAEERKMALNEQKRLMTLQLSHSTEELPIKLKKTPRSERRQSGPLKVYSIHTKTEQRSETQVSKRNSAVEEIISITSSSVVSRISSESDCESMKELLPQQNVHLDHVKKSLLLREEALQKRRREAEELLQWHERLKEEEMKIQQLEQQAARSIPQNIPEKTNIITGSQLNHFLKNITGMNINKFDDKKKFSMSQKDLENFFIESRKIFHEISDDNSDKRKSSFTDYVSDFEIASSIKTLDNVLDSVSSELVNQLSSDSERSRKTIISDNERYEKDNHLHDSITQQYSEKDTNKTLTKLNKTISESLMNIIKSEINRITDENDNGNIQTENLSIDDKISNIQTDEITSEIKSNTISARSDIKSDYDSDHSIRSEIKSDDSEKHSDHSHDSSKALSTIAEISDVSKSDKKSEEIIQSEIISTAKPESNSDRSNLIKKIKEEFESIKSEVFDTSDEKSEIVSDIKQPDVSEEKIRESDETNSDRVQSEIISELKTHQSPSEEIHEDLQVISPEQKSSKISEMKSESIIKSDQQSESIIQSDKQSESVIPSEKYSESNRKSDGSSESDKKSERSSDKKSEKSSDIKSEKILEANIKSDTPTEFDKISESIIKSDKNLETEIESDKHTGSDIKTDKYSEPVITSDKFSESVIASDKLSEPAITSDKFSEPVITSDKFSEPAITSDRYSESERHSETNVIPDDKSEKHSETVRSSESVIKSEKQSDFITESDKQSESLIKTDNHSDIKESITKSDKFLKISELSEKLDTLKTDEKSSENKKVSDAIQESINTHLKSSEKSISDKPIKSDVHTTNSDENLHENEKSISEALQSHGHEISASHTITQKSDDCSEPDTSNKIIPNEFQKSVSEVLQNNDNKISASDTIQKTSDELKSNSQIIPTESQKSSPKSDTNKTSTYEKSNELKTSESMSSKLYKILSKESLIPESLQNSDLTRKSIETLEKLIQDASKTSISLEFVKSISDVSTHSDESETDLKIKSLISDLKEISSKLESSRNKSNFSDIQEEFPSGVETDQNETEFEPYISDENTSRDVGSDFNIPIESDVISDMSKSGRTLRSLESLLSNVEHLARISEDQILSDDQNLEGNKQSEGKSSPSEKYETSDSRKVLDDNILSDDQKLLTTSQRENLLEKSKEIQKLIQNNITSEDKISEIPETSESQKISANQRLSDTQNLSDPHSESISEDIKSEKYIQKIESEHQNLSGDLSESTQYNKIPSRRKGVENEEGDNDTHVSLSLDNVSQGHSDVSEDVTSLHDSEEEIRNVEIKISDPSVLEISIKITTDEDSEEFSSKQKDRSSKVKKKEEKSKKTEKILSKNDEKTKKVEEKSIKFEEKSKKIEEKPKKVEDKSKETEDKSKKNEDSSNRIEDTFEKFQGSSEQVEEKSVESGRKVQKIEESTTIDESLEEDINSQVGFEEIDNVHKDPIIDSSEDKKSSRETSHEDESSKLRTEDKSLKSSTVDKSLTSDIEKITDTKDKSSKPDIEKSSKVHYEEKSSEIQNVSSTPKIKPSELTEDLIVKLSPKSNEEDRLSKISSKSNEEDYISEFEADVESTGVKSEKSELDLNLKELNSESSSSLSSNIEECMDTIKESPESRSSSNRDDVHGVSHIDVRKRVSEILADTSGNASRGDKSPRLQDFYVTTYDVMSPSPGSSPELGSPTGELDQKEKDSLIRKTIYGSEAEELLRKQLEIEQEIKRLEQQQKENVPYCFMREIPNKPPPPYKPPVIAPKVTTVIPTDVRQVNTFVNKASEILYNDYAQGKLSEKSSANIGEKINSYKFIFDICKEIALEIQDKTKQDNSGPSWMQLKQKIKPPEYNKEITKDMLKSVMSRKVQQLLGFEQVNRKDNLIIRWSRKKRDHVDEILVLEAQTEESEWTNYDKDALTVKDNLTNDIFDTLLSDTVETMSNIIKKRLIRNN